MSLHSTSWVKVPAGSDFPIQNLPYGIFDDGQGARAGVAIGEHILDLASVARLDGFKGIALDTKVFSAASLNPFIDCGKAVGSAVRQRIADILKAGSDWDKHANAILVKQSDASMLMPVQIGDYTDFYASKEHATNVGIMFRGKENALMPNWKHIPIGYHGRSSSIVVSGTDIHRPKGQFMPKDATSPVFGPSQRMDFELEVGFIVGKSTAMGETVAIENAEDYIFGFVLFNDWSARDIQGWEYVPLGPFLGKNFGSSVSAWLVPIEALEPFRVPGPVQDVTPLPYLQFSGNHSFDIKLEVELAPENAPSKVISQSNFSYMYWNICQQLAHHTINGCNINVGDMMASGTISGPTKEAFGSMLEITWGGQEPLEMPDGSTRKFLADNDTVIMRGFCEKEGLRIGFGEVRGKLLPAI